MSSTIIKFLTGTTEQLAQRTVGLQNYIALNTATGQMFWNYNGTKYLINYKSDWDESDSSLPTYIKNKPSIPTIEDLIQNLDISDLSDSQGLIHTHKELIDPSQVQADGNGRYFLTLSTQRPSQLMVGGTLYSIQTDSLTINEDNVFTIQLSRYMAYQGVTQVPSNWKLLYT